LLKEFLAQKIKNGTRKKPQVTEKTLTTTGSVKDLAHGTAFA